MFETQVSLIFIGILVLIGIGILSQIRLNSLENKVKKLDKLSLENKKILDKLNQETIWIIKDLEGEVLELQKILKENK